MGLPFPTDTLCPICGKVFQQKQRVQGGGRRSIYCSTECCKQRWLVANPERRKAQVLAYDRKPDSIEAKRRRSFLGKLKKYKLTEQQFYAMHVRQLGHCAICMEPIDESAAIDHCHATGKVRGILCHNCNWALGHARDNRGRLYQMAAYLELDRTKPVVYVVGSLQNEAIPILGDTLRTAGYEVVDNWFAAGKEADMSWQHYSKGRGKTYAEALQSREASHVFFFDRSYINLSDAVVLLYSAGKSAHLEFGYAVGRGKKGYILMPEQPEKYDVMTQFASVPVMHDEAALLAQLRLDFPHA